MDNARQNYIERASANMGDRAAALAVVSGDYMDGFDCSDRHRSRSCYAVVRQVIAD
jgi:hypothetical protein